MVDVASEMREHLEDITEKVASNFNLKWKNEGICQDQKGKLRYWRTDEKTENREKLKGKHEKLRKAEKSKNNLEIVPKTLRIGTQILRKTESIKN